MVSKIIQWIKSHLTLVICSTIGLASIVALVLGFILPDAQASLTSTKSVYDALHGVAAKAANERVIEDARTKQGEIRRSVQRFLADAAKAAPRVLLNADVFPEVKEPFAPAVFKDRCEQRRKQFLAVLKAQDCPSQSDIADYKAAMDKLEQKKKKERGETYTPGLPTGPGMAAAAPPSRGERMSGPSSLRMEGPGAGAGVALEAVMPANITPQEWVAKDSGAGASVKRATEVYCYAAETAFDPRSVLTDKYPAVELMWEAQLSMWIQEDIVTTLARINKDAADALPEENRWVAYLPVKHLLYIASTGYLPKTAAGEGAAKLGGAGFATDVSSPAAPAGIADLTFTKQGSTESVDTVQVAVGLVVDAGSLLKVIDEIKKAGFYTPTLVSYESLEYNSMLRGYIYGSSPVVRVRLELQYCILRDKLLVKKDEKSRDELKYVDLLPATIKAGTWQSTARGPAAGPQMGPGPMMGPSRMPGPRGGDRMMRPSREEGN
jgi:hypothetical protein